MRYEKLSPPTPRSPGVSSVSCTNCCGSRTGSHRSINASIRLKIAVLAPIPSASVSTITSVKPGVFTNRRSA